MTPWTPAPPEANHPSRRPRAQSLPNRPNHRSPLPPPVPDERRSHISPRQGLTPCSPLRRRPTAPNAVPAPGGDPLDPRSAGHPAKKNAVPASRRMSTVLAGGRDGLPRPRSAGRPPKTIALPAPGGDPLDPRSAIRAGPPTPSPRPGVCQPCLRGAVTAPAPAPPGRSRKHTPSPRPGVCQPSLRGRNRPFRGRLSRGYPCFPIIQPLFMDKIPLPWAFVPSAAFFLKMSKKPLLPCRSFLLPVSLLKFCFSFVFGSVNAQKLCLFVQQPQNYIRAYTIEPAQRDEMAQRQLIDSIFIPGIHLLRGAKHQRHIGLLQILSFTQFT